MRKPTPPVRVLIYARGTDEQIAVQHARCQRDAERLGEDIVSVASDPPDGCSGWASARNMLADREVDRIRVTSRDVTPLAPFIDSASREVRSPYKCDPQHRRPRRL